MARPIRPAFPDVPSVPPGLAAVRGGERFPEPVSLLGVGPYAHGLVTGHVDIAPGVNGAVGTLSLRFDPTLLLDDR